MLAKLALLLLALSSCQETYPRNPCCGGGTSIPGQTGPRDAGSDPHDDLADLLGMLNNPDGGR